MRSKNSRRRGYGLPLVLIVLFVSSMAVIAVSEHAIKVSKYQRTQLDVRAAREALRSAQGWVAGQGENWLNVRGAFPETTLDHGTFRVVVTAGSAPAEQVQRVLNEPKTSGCKVTLEARPIVKPQADRVPPGLRREYLALFQAGQPVRLVLLTETRLDAGR